MRMSSHWCATTISGRRLCGVDAEDENLMSRVVDAVADADVLLVALEVDVRRAAVHGVGQWLQLQIISLAPVAQQMHRMQGRSRIDIDIDQNGLILNVDR